MYGKDNGRPIVRKHASVCLVQLYAIELGTSSVEEGINIKSRVQYGSDEQQHHDMAVLLS